MEMSQDNRTEDQIDIEETGAGEQPESSGAEPGTCGQAEAGSRTGEADAREADSDGTGESGQEPEGEEEENRNRSGSRRDPRDVQIEELQDKLKRQMAEFDNFRKRTDKEKSAMYEIGARDMIEKILPVLDNFERGLAAVPEDLKDSSFAEGVAMIYKQFVKTLEDAGVEAIEAVGQPFDPNLHNAVMHIDDDAYGENEISQELQKGYRYRGTVVRHSMVQVAN